MSNQQKEIKVGDEFYSFVPNRNIWYKTLVMSIFTVHGVLLAFFVVLDLIVE